MDRYDAKSPIIQCILLVLLRENWASNEEFRRETVCLSGLPSLGSMPQFGQLTPTWSPGLMRLWVRSYPCRHRTWDLCNTHKCNLRPALKPCWSTSTYWRRTLWSRVWLATTTCKSSTQNQSQRRLTNALFRSQRWLFSMAPFRIHLFWAQVRFVKAKLGRALCCEWLISLALMTRHGQARVPELNRIWTWFKSTFLILARGWTKYIYNLIHVYIHLQQLEFPGVSQRRHCSQ